MGFIRVLRGMKQSKSLIFPSPINKGRCVQEIAANKEQGQVATNKFYGILIQEVTANGPDFAVQNAGIPIDEIPVGNAGLLRIGEGEIVTDVIAVSPDTGPLSAAVVGDKLGIANGKWRVAQTGDTVFGELLEKDFGIAGRYRIQVFRSAVVTP